MGDESWPALRPAACCPACFVRIRMQEKTRTHGGDGRWGRGGGGKNGKAARSVPSLRLVLDHFAWLRDAVAYVCMYKQGGTRGHGSQLRGSSLLLSRTSPRGCRGQRCGRVVVLFWSLWCFCFWACFPSLTAKRPWVLQLASATVIGVFVQGIPGLSRPLRASAQLP